MRILFIRENQSACEPLIACLEQNGLECAVAASAEEALDALRGKPFDLVVSELHIRDMDGGRLARIIRTGVYETRADVPIMVVSTALSAALSRQLLDEGQVDEFIGLPCEAESFLERVQRHGAGEAEGGSEPPEARSILLVDDEPEFLDMLSASLSGLGYRLLTALNGDEAIRLVKSERPSLVLLDYLIAETNGIVLLKEIRQLQPDTLVVMLTGHGSSEVAVEALWAGAADYLEKPVQHKVLQKALVDVLRRGQTHRMAGYLHGQIRQMRDQGRRIERLKRMNDAIVGSLPDPLCVVDGSGGIVTANASFWKNMGGEPTIEGQPLSSVVSSDAFNDRIEQAMRSGRPESGVEFEHAASEGRNRYYRARILPLGTGSGGLEGLEDGAVMALLQDVTEQHRATEMEEALRAEREQTKLTSTFVQMLSGAAHELNNPLAVIMGLSDLGRTPDPSSSAEQTAEMFARILEQSRRCQKIVKDLTAFLAADRADMKPGSIYDVLEVALDSKKRMIEESKITLDLLPRKSLPTAELNAERLAQVFANLIDNACRAVREREEPGTGEIRIRMGIEPGRPSPMVRVEIANNGPNIPEEDLQRIFLPFVTNRKVGEGRGLGLSVCYGVVRNHGGKIRAQNLIDGGCAFTVLLPVAGHSRPEIQ